MFRFSEWYILLMIFPVIALFFVRRKNGTIPFSSIAVLKAKPLKKNMGFYFGKFLILAGVIFILTGLARPQIVDEKTREKKYGMDIVIALDVSQSMKAENQLSNWLETAKHVAGEFVDKRINDRLGLVIFSGTAYTKLPLTADREIVREVIRTIQAEDVNKNGTAIGTGLSVAVNRLKNSDAKSRMVILLTDGDNNTGTITPETAVMIAKTLGIKVYTIGVGNDSDANGVYGQITGGLNEELLKYIAGETKGRYFRAKTGEILKAVFAEIDKNEKTKIEALHSFNYQELYYGLFIIGLMLITAGIILEELIFTRIP